MNPKVSIIVPVYKAEKYLPATINSLLLQDYDNFEVVLVDDGSPDSSGSICDEYMMKDSRVVVFHKDNGGVTSARRFGIEKATGEWIIFVDADDQLRDGAISYYVNAAIKYNADIVITPNLRFSDGEWKPVNMFASGVYDRPAYLKLLANGLISSGIGGKLMKKNLFEEGTLIIPRSITNNEDLLMNFRLSHKLKKIYCDKSNSFYMYFVREGSATMTTAGKNDWMLLYKILSSMQDECGDAVSDFIALSVSDCLLAGLIHSSLCKEYIRYCHWEKIIPFRFWWRVLMVRYPNTITRSVVKLSESIYFRINRI